MIPSTLDPRGDDVGTPALMRVATARAASAPVLGLDRELPLLGGGRKLLPTGLPLALGMEHQPDFLRAVAHACRAQSLAGRDWYSHGAITMIGPKGSGRGHAARRLAAATGLPLFVVDVSSDSGRRLLAGDAPTGCVPMPPAAVTAVAASGCANPIILVEGVPSNQGTVPLLAPFLDPDRGCRFVSEPLRAKFDLGQVNWLIQVESEAAARRLPEDWSSTVRFRQCLDQDHRLLRMSLIAAVAEEQVAAGGVAADALREAIETALRGRRNVSSIAEIVDDLVIALPAGGRGP